jgi:predicted nucleic acid-binding protein
MARTREVRSRRVAAAPPQRLILDSGAVIALSRRDARARAELTAAWEAGAEVSIPAPVVAETVRGSTKDAPVNRVIKAVGAVTSLDEATGRVAGGLLGVTRSDATVDALVVATALRLGGGVILTSDAHDLHSLSSGQQEIVVRAL